MMNPQIWLVVVTTSSTIFVCALCWLLIWMLERE
jgi:hypothetical protein